MRTLQRCRGNMLGRMSVRKCMLVSIHHLCAQNWEGDNVLEGGYNRLTDPAKTKMKTKTEVNTTSMTGVESALYCDHRNKNAGRTNVKLRVAPFMAVPIIITATVVSTIFCSACRQS